MKLGLGRSIVKRVIKVTHEHNNVNFLKIGDDAVKIVENF